MIADNIRYVKRRIGDAKLVCVTKAASIEEIEEAMRSGITMLGENRVQDALAKYAVIGNGPEWHLIGHLQTNKVRDAVRMFSLIHSVDSLRLAASIDKEASKIGKVQDILIQVNTSGEASKFGIGPGQAEGLLRDIEAYRNIRVRGLMTIAPEAADPESARPYFRALRELRDRLKLEILSMGMTNDFEVAIGEGSNMVRVGRAIFQA